MPAGAERLTKVEMGTVGTAPQVLTDLERRKLAESETPAARARLAAEAAGVRADAAPLFALPSAFSIKAAELRTFVAMPDFSRLALNPAKLLQLETIRSGSHGPVVPVPIHERSGTAAKAGGER
jgi:hypothetical protein